MNPESPMNPVGLRDYFAAAALTGIIASYTASDQTFQLPGDEEAAEWAYDYADAMLEQRKTQPST